jgi:hypothetical protein
VERGWGRGGGERESKKANVYIITKLLSYFIQENT